MPFRHLSSSGSRYSKTGASAVYGSDAIGGVVNIITKTAIEGIEIDYYAGTAGAGDGRNYGPQRNHRPAKRKRSHRLFGWLSQPATPFGPATGVLASRTRPTTGKRTTAPITKTAARPPRKATSSTAWVPRGTKHGRRSWRRLATRPVITTATRRPAGVPSIGRGSHPTAAATRTTTNRRTISTPRRRATALFSAVLIPWPRERRRISR